MLLSNCAFRRTNLIFLYSDDRNRKVSSSFFPRIIVIGTWMSKTDRRTLLWILLWSSERHQRVHIERSQYFPWCIILNAMQGGASRSWQNKILTFFQNSQHHYSLIPEGSFWKWGEFSGIIQTKSYFVMNSNFPDCVLEIIFGIFQTKAKLFFWELREMCRL